MKYVFFDDDEDKANYLYDMAKNDFPEKLESKFEISYKNAIKRNEERSYEG